MMRIGIDLGTTSLGWCLLRLDAQGRPTGIIDGGVRLFSDGREPKSGTSLAVDRRNARALRRRRDRYLRRRRVLLQELVRFGLMPEDATARRALADLDPYAIRRQALDTAVPLHHLGRALFQLNQRRGFKSNRKAERKSDDDLGVVATGNQALDAAMTAVGARTFGEYLAMRHEKRQGTRVRKRDDEGAYAFYPARRHLEEEFDALWNAQAAHHPDVLTDDARTRLFDIIFYQRPLKDPKVGRCRYVEGEERLPKAHPLFQRFRLYKELNELGIAADGEAARPLTKHERELLLNKLKGKRKVTFKTLLKALKLGEGVRFNKESEARQDLLGDEVEAALAHNDRLGARWYNLSIEDQWVLVERLREEENPEELHAWLTSTYNIDADHARKVAGAHLPEGHGRLGETATRTILEELEADIITESLAVERAGWHHSDTRTGEVWDELPYYGKVSELQRMIPPGSDEPDDPDDVRYGRITNPTVHIGLNQLRRVINGVIARYGKPDEIIVELARDLKQNEEQKKQANKINAKNRRAAEERSKKLDELGVADTGRNRAILRLWEDLHPDPMARVCIYTGEKISARMLFSGETDIDHILPVRRTLDDSGANKLICMKEANRRKGDRTPWEAFSGAEWEAIAVRAGKLPPNKRWRFAPDAMERFEQDRDFIARQMTDTQYLSKIARTYLTALYPERGEGSQHVFVIPGRFTEMLRRNWKLNELLPDHNFVEDGAINQKINRLDHRHHMIDACIAAVTDRRLLNQIARLAGANEAQQIENIFKGLRKIEPWDGFRDDLKAALDRTVISHKPDHGTIAFSGRTSGRDQTAGKLHNDTAYGLTGKTDARGNEIVANRLPLSAFVDDKKIMMVPDPGLRDALAETVKGRTGKDRLDALHRFARENTAYRGLRRVRVEQALKTIKIHDRQGRAYKGYKGDANYRYDVWRLPDGKWKADVITLFDAHQPTESGRDRRPHPAAKRVLSLHQNDMLAIEDPNRGRLIVRVVKFDQSGSIYLAAHQEAGDLKKRDAIQNEIDPFKYIKKAAGPLKKLKARQIRIDELGRVWDPGPRE